MILGARTAEQLAANLAATTVVLSSDDLQKLNAVSALQANILDGCSTAKAAIVARKSG